MSGVHRSVLTVGSFDMLHRGHVSFLHKVKRLGGYLVVGLNTDNFFLQGKHKSRLVMTYEERYDVLNALWAVNEVVPNDTPTIRPLLQTFRPAVLAIGSDWFSDDHSVYLNQIGITAEELEDEFKTTLVYVPYDERISSTLIKGRVLDQYTRERLDDTPR